jgi:hypothetical protein
MSSALRRVLVLLMLVSAVAAAAAWWRDRDPAGGDAEPPSWPPLEPLTTGTEAPATPPSTDDPAVGTVAPWRAGNADGSTPDGFPVKAKESSGIYHVPGGRFYDRTKPDRCYATADAAEADGYRRSKT